MSARWTQQEFIYQTLRLRESHRLSQLEEINGSRMTDTTIHVSKSKLPLGSQALQLDSSTSGRGI